MWGPRDVTRPPQRSLELVRGLLVVGECSHGRRGRAAFFEQVAQALGEHPCLARAGRGDDPGATAGVADRGELVGGQVGLGWVAADWGERSRLGAPAVHDAGAVGVGCGGERTAVDPESRSVGELDVGAVRFLHPLGGEGPQDLATVPPDRLSVAGVVVVGPHQEMQPLAGELEVGAQLVDGQPAGLTLLQHLWSRRRAPL